MQNPIVFYDGECGFCNHWVQWILDRDLSGVFRFAALQSRFSAELFKAYNQQVTMESLIVLTPDKKFLARSEAVIYLLEKLKPGSLPHRVLHALPKVVGDAGYSVIASVRKLLRRNRCRVFTKEERRFILNDTEFSPDSFSWERKKL